MEIASFHICFPLFLFPFPHSKGFILWGTVLSPIEVSVYVVVSVKHFSISSVIAWIS